MTRPDERGSAWATQLLGLAVDEHAQTCASAASLALVEQATAPEQVSEDTSKAPDVIGYPRTIDAALVLMWTVEPLK